MLQSFLIIPHNFLHHESLNQDADEEHLQDSLEDKSVNVSPLLVEGPSEAKPGYFEGLDDDEHPNLSMGCIIEKRERDNHHEFLIVGQNVIIVWPEPLFGTPGLF